MRHCILTKPRSPQSSAWLQPLKRKLTDDGSAAAPSAAWERQRGELIAACEAALGCSLQGQQAGIELAGSAAADAAAEHSRIPGEGGHEHRGSSRSMSRSSSRSMSSATRPRLIIFNLFTLEGFHIAEALGVPCLAASPCLPPYGMPAGFKRRFERAHPQLLSRLQAAEGGWAGD